MKERDTVEQADIKAPGSAARRLATALIFGLCAPAALASPTYSEALAQKACYERQGPRPLACREAPGHPFREATASGLPAAAPGTLLLVAATLPRVEGSWRPARLPEPDAPLMLLAGAGLMAFVALRRRQVATALVQSR